MRPTLMRRLPMLLPLFALLVAGCSSIPLGEEDVFMPKATVTPADLRSDTLGVRALTFPAAGDSVRLSAWHLTKPDARGTVLFFGGQGFYLVQSKGYVEALTRLPVDVLMIDYRGYGRSGGTPTVSAVKDDALAAYAYAVDSLGIDPARLVVHGHSLGTFVALHTATERPVAGAVLENPATSVEAWADHLVPWYLRLFISFDIAEALRGESNLERIRTLEAPVMIVGGSEDVITAPEMARELHEAAGSETKLLEVVEGGTHNELYDASAYHRLYRDLLDAAFE